MSQYLLGRIASTGLVLVGVSALTFFIAHVVPADPVLVALGEHAREDQIQAYRRAYGLDRPVLVQYLLYMGRLAQGDLGVSIRTRRPVADDLREFLPATIELGTAAWVVALLLGVPAGIVSAIYKDRLFDHLCRIAALMGASMPVFWLGLLLLGNVYYRLRWLPGPGRLDIALSPPPSRTGLLLVDALLAGDGAVFGNALLHLVLPGLTLGLFSTAVVARMTRSAMLEVLYQDYVRTAWAKGLPGRRVVLRHALRNAMIPTLTIIGIAFGNLLSGAVLTETVFAWPGLGRYATTSAVSLDFPAVVGVTLVAAVIYTLVNLVVDLLYVRLDPRVRYD
ncbi:MAG: ABC transporter permease [Armatimonadota bacterium]|nr:ABC transporter permease [Armatimonadota bacterium]MDR7459748.1 ABC transporter permease [Armatimonadota bacterium]MDR7478594.1 ABC transporter permease [Armatimonadota bacterium]MDR7488428.1 ABC transporter permease [Armatimonadota bacterium]MDR7489906.1 ABC transporter permease [Armatimonadota bacterium]